MVWCRSCGRENRSEALYCADCGAALPATVQPPSLAAPLRCRTCGQDNPPQAKFCAACGASLPQKVAIPTRAAGFNHRAALYKWVAIGVVALLVVSGTGYGLMSLAGKPRNTPLPPEKIVLQTLIYQDDFSSPDSGWIRRDTGKAEFGQGNGEYHFRLKDPAVFSVWNPGAGQFKDVTLEIDARMVSGNISTGYGVVFRLKDSDNFYRFMVFGDGSYIIGKKVNGKWIEVQQWTKNAFINKGNATNRLRVVCRGSLMEASVNGHHLTNIRDDSFTEGFIGMFVGTRESDNHVAFDNIRVYKFN